MQRTIDVFLHGDTHYNVAAHGCQYFVFFLHYRPGRPFSASTNSLINPSWSIASSMLAVLFNPFTVYLLNSKLREEEVDDIDVVYLFDTAITTFLRFSLWSFFRVDLFFILNQYLLYHFPIIHIQLSDLKKNVNKSIFFKSVSTSSFFFLPI